MDTSFVNSLSATSSQSEWSRVSTWLQSSSEPTEVKYKRCSQLLMKVNTIYADVSCCATPNTVLDSCCQALVTDDNWKLLDDKYKISTAKILSHISVKVLNKGSHSLCNDLCKLLIAIVLDPQLDISSKDILSITGYVYRSLWNRHSVASSVPTPREIEYKGRVMALRLAVAGSKDENISKLFHQITVTVTEGSNSDIHRETLLTGLSEMRQTVEVAVDKVEKPYLWKHLSLYISCLEAIFSDYTSIIKVSAGLSMYGDICQRLLDSYHCVKAGRAIEQPLSAGVQCLLSKSTTTVELRSIAYLLSRIVKLVDPSSLPQNRHDVKILITWKDLLLADVFVNRRLFELDSEGKGKQHLSRVANIACAMLQMSADAICGSSNVSTDILLPDTELISLISQEGLEYGSKPITNLLTTVLKILQYLQPRIKTDCSRSIHTLRQLGTSALFLAASQNMDFAVLIQRQLCDLLAKRSLFGEALDVFTKICKAPRQHWAVMVSDWCKIKKLAVLAEDRTLSTRVLGVEVFGKEINKDEMIWLLHKEYCEFNLREAYYEEMVATLKAMMSCAMSDSHRAIYHLCKAELYISLDKDREDVESCLTKGLALLKDNTSVFSNDLRAQLYTWQYRFNYQEYCAMPQLNTALTDLDYPTPATTFKAESTLLQPLFDAISLWGGVSGAHSKLYSEQKTAECLSVIVHTLYLSRRFNKALEVCELATKLLSTNHFLGSTVLLHLEVLIELGDLNRAEELLDELTGVPDQSALANENILLVKAKLCCYSDMIDEAVEILEQIIEGANKLSLNNVYLSAAAHCMLLDILINCTSVNTKHTISYHAWYCQRDHSCLFTSMSSHPVKTYGAKLRYLDSILSSYITLGKVNLFIGSVRESTCFLSAGLNMAKHLFLPLRAADITNHQAKLDCFLDDIVGAEANLRHSHIILTSQMTLGTQRIVKHSDVELTPKRLKPVRKDLNKVKSDDIFGFESDDTGDDSFSIHQPSNVASDDDENAEYKVPIYGTNRSRDLTASPSFNKNRKFATSYTEWGPYTHRKTCVCAECSEHKLHVAHLDMLDTVCICRLKLGSHEEAVVLARNAQICCKMLGSRPTVLSEKEPLQLITRQLQFSRTIMTCLLVTNNYSDIEKEWRRAQLFPCTQYHSMGLGQLAHLQSLPHIMKFYQPTTASGMSDLDMKLESLKLNDIPVFSPLRPIKTNSNNAAPPSGLSKAPKKNRVLNVNRIAKPAFDDSDTEGTPKQSMSSRKSGRSAKSASTKAKTKVVSLSNRVLSPLACGSAKPRTRTMRKQPITVFCDDENDSNQENSCRKPSRTAKEKPLEPKRSSRARPTSSTDGDSLEMLQPVRTRKARTTNKEVMRGEDRSPSDEGMMLPAVIEDVPVVTQGAVSEDLSLTVDSALAARTNEMDVVKGDKPVTVIKPRSRKYSAAERMRSAAPSHPTSPPELLTSPPPELIQRKQRSKSSTEIDEEIANLTTLWRSLHKNPPFNLYRSVCQSLGVLHYTQSNMWLAAFYLMETQAITFTHKTNLVTVQKQHLRNKEPNMQAHGPLFELPSSRSLTHFKEAVSCLSSGWITCCITVVSAPGSNLQQLYVTRLEANQDPVVLLITQMVHPQEIWGELEDILKASKDTMYETEKSSWWEKRRELDKRLKDLLTKIQIQLGVSRTALLGCYVDKKARLVVEKCTDCVIKELSALGITVDRSMIQMLVNGADDVKEVELSHFFQQRFPQLSKQKIDKVCDLVMEGRIVNIDTREPLIICLDKTAHSICWESMPYLSQNPISRMPSIYSIQTYLRVLPCQANSVYTNGVDAQKAFYILNPDDNLPITESFFKPILGRKKTWNGITAQQPSPEQYKIGLTAHDLFIFLGHGSGSKYLKGRELCQIDCRAAALLMGCSSGALDSRGEMESAGIIYDYHIAKCPSVLACLWDVTDKDIDRYTKSILENWLNADENQQSLLDHIPSARRACKLPYMVGSSSVVYGLPISIANKLVWSQIPNTAVQF